MTFGYQFWPLLMPSYGYRRLDHMAGYNEASPPITIAAKPTIAMSKVICSAEGHTKESPGSPLSGSGIQ